MKSYADENFYKTEFLCGKKAVITTAFEYYARFASQIIDCYTHGNIGSENIPECVKLCCCELAEMIYRDEQSEKKNGGVSSESVQGWSKSYEDTESRRTALKIAQRDCVYKWLGDSGLLYSGVRRC